MNKKDIQRKYREKIRLISKFNNFYYNKSDPLVSDSEYDNLKKDIIF